MNVGGRTIDTHTNGNENAEDWESSKRMSQMDEMPYETEIKPHQPNLIHATERENIGILCGGFHRIETRTIFACSALTQKILTHFKCQKQFFNYSNQQQFEKIQSALQQWFQSHFFLCCPFCFFFSATNHGSNDFYR